MLIQLKDLTKTINGKNIVELVNLEIELTVLVNQ